MPKIDKDIFPPDKEVAKKDGKVCRHDSCPPSTCRLDVAADAVSKIASRLDSVDRRLDGRGATYSKHNDVAYKGYLIKTSPLRGDVFVVKDGHNIATVSSVAAAKQTIDNLA